MKALTSNILPEEFIVAMQESPETLKEITSTEESGAALFRMIDADATRRFKIGWKEISRAILWLHTIREYSLWRFGGYKNWEHYLSTWIDNGARERTTVRNGLKVIRLWTGPTLQLPPSDLISYEEGLASVEPLFVGSESIIADVSDGGYDPRSGEIKRLKAEWETKLPGTSNKEKIVSLIGDIPRDATKTRTRDMLRDEIPTATLEFSPTFKNGKWSGVVCDMYDAEGKLVHEVIHDMSDIIPAAMSLGLQGKLMSMLRIPRELREV